MTRPKLALAFTLAALVGCGGHAPPNQWELQSARYLEAAYDQMLGGRGYSIESEFTGSLYDNASQTYDVRLRGGQAYAILGACDNDCSDIDLYLTDENGNQLDSDTATDDFPIVRYSPRRNGTFRLRVRMYECSVNPCYFAVGVYARDR